MVCEKCTKKLNKLATVHKATPSSSKKVVNENKFLTAHTRFKKDKDEYKRCKLCGRLTHHIKSHYCQECAYQKGICAMCGKKIYDVTNYKQTEV